MFSENLSTSGNLLSATNYRSLCILRTLKTFLTCIKCISIVADIRPARNILQNFRRITAIHFHEALCYLRVFSLKLVKLGNLQIRVLRVLYMELSEISCGNFIKLQWFFFDEFFTICMRLPEALSTLDTCKLLFLMYRT